MSNRKSRKQSIEISEKEISKPLDVLSMGSADDPCFGKEWDLKAKECKRCGDSEICAVVMAQGMKAIRAEIESDNRFKDLEEAEIIDNPDIRKYIDKKLALGWDKKKIIKRISKRFKKTQTEAKEFYQSYKTE